MQDLYLGRSSNVVKTIKSDRNAMLTVWWQKEKTQVHTRTERGTEGQKDVIDTVSDISLDSST